MDFPGGCAAVRGRCLRPASMLFTERRMRESLLVQRRRQFSPMFLNGIGDPRSRPTLACDAGYGLNRNLGIELVVGEHRKTRELLLNGAAHLEARGRRDEEDRRSDSSG